MALVTNNNDGKLEANKMHLYIREAAAAPSPYTNVAVSAAISITEATPFPKVETGFTIDQAEGDTIMTTTGQKIVLSKNSSGEFNAMGLTPTTYNALMDETDGYNQKDVDIFLIQAPLDRTLHTADVGDYVYAIYNVNLNIKLNSSDGQPTKVVLSYERVDSATDTGTVWEEVVAV